MKQYELSEFVFLLRLGLWNGGDVAGIGYISKVRDAEAMQAYAGCIGMRLGSDVMLEHSRTNAYGETEMTFSVYDPYTGSYRCQAVTAHQAERAEEALLWMNKEMERENLSGKSRHSTIKRHHRGRYRADTADWWQG